MDHRSLASVGVTNSRNRNSDNKLQLRQQMSPGRTESKYIIKLATLLAECDYSTKAGEKSLKRSRISKIDLCIDIGNTLNHFDPAGSFRMRHT